MITTQKDDHERKVVLYARVSTPEMETHESSRTMQINAASNYLKRQKLAPLSHDCVYIDYGWSKDQRSSLPKLLHDIHFGYVGTVLVWHIDRLTRSLAEFIKLMDSFATHNVSLCSTQQMVRYSPEIMKMLIPIMQALSEFEQSAIRDRRRLAKSKQKNR